MAIALEATTAISLGGPDANLATKATLMQVGMRALAGNRCLRNSTGTAIAFAKAFQPRLSRVAADICGLWLPSLMRRPLWHGGEALVGILVGL